MTGSPPSAPTPRATWRLVSAAAVVAGALVACARPEAPRGGPEDRTPPYILEAEPDTFAQVPPGLQEIRFRFSERISERASTGTLNDAVLVSPSVGNVQVRHQRDGIEVRVQDGLQAGQVYRITVLPVIVDMFGNRLQDAFDLVLSTGGTPVPNVVAGVAEDRITGRPVEGARVEAAFGFGTDTVIHWNFTDPEGIYSLRYVPDGSYDLRVYEDRNRNGELDPTEPRAGPFPGQIQTPLDTAFAVVSLIAPDTTPPRLTSAEAVDSSAVLLTFDDFLEPLLDLGTLSVTVADSAAGSEVEIELMNEVDFSTREGGEGPPTDQAPVPDPPPVDTAGAGPPDGSGAPETVADRTQPRVGLSGLPLPAQTLYGVLGTPLQAGVTYRVEISGLVNIAGTGQGGGEAMLTWEPPPPDTTPQADSIPGGDPAGDSVPPDTIPPDTLFFQRSQASLSPRSPAFRREGLNLDGAHR
ncbi:MAG: hypothetical protein HKO53_08970 [Gemmatimonadetes bacterium]|nr:hypothetical protein [Gemmatimonadota bacterium]